MCKPMRCGRSSLKSRCPHLGTGCCQKVNQFLMYQACEMMLFKETEQSN
jgi:hypothetical protein